jgi:hypothetical protein
MRAGVFSPGGTLYEETNLWRETSFALHLIIQAVNPRLDLNACIKNWKNIAKSLAENPRKRKGAMNNLWILS